MSWLQCKHCEQFSMILMDKEEWCYKCGYDNELSFPLRHPTKRERIADGIPRFQNVVSGVAWSNSNDYKAQYAEDWRNERRVSGYALKR